MQRTFIYRIWNFTLTPFDTFKYTVDTALDSGFNCIMVHIPWALAQPTAAAPKYEDFDKLIDYVVYEKKVKVILSVDLTRRENDALVGYEHIQLDPNGKISLGDGRTEISFCSEYAVGLAVDFYKDFVGHYNKKYGKDILLYMPALSQYAETEYWNREDYDYSPYALRAFTDFLKEKFAGVDELNQALDAKYTSFEEVQAPSCYDKSALGVLWYQFRHKKLKMVIDRLGIAQKEVAPETEYGVQFGCVYDPATIRRATYAFADLCEHVDVMWVDDAPTYDHDWSIAYARAGVPAHIKIAQEIDSPTAPGATVEVYRDQAHTSYLYGTNYLNIANWQIDDHFRQYMPLWREVADTWFTGNPPEMIVPDENSPVVKVSLLDMFKLTNPTSYIDLFHKAAEGGKAVKLEIVDDLTK